MKKKLLSSKVKTILILAVILAILAAVVTAVVSGTPFFTNAVNTILSPIRSGVAAIDRKAEQYYNYLFSYEALQAKNAELEQRILSMAEDVRSAETYQRENERLKMLLNLKDEHEDYELVSAHMPASNYRSTFTIGKGSGSGLEEGMCAVTENGQVVGLITEVGANWSTITTIHDSSLEISASIASSGYTGVVQGTYLSDGSSVLRMNYLPTDAILKNDDQVVTTGSTLYPRGLLLGYLTNVGLDETGVAKYATLEASCDLANLEQIFIITQFSNQ